MTPELQTLIDTVRTAPDSVLLKSRMNCHAKHVDSIVVREADEGRLKRAFLAWPGHQLITNRLESRNMAVGIHDHRYDLMFSLIAGRVRNTIYERCNEHEGVLLHSMRFGSHVEAKERGTVVNDGCEFVRVARERYLEMDSGVRPRHQLAADELHNIDCIGPAAWWVWEMNNVKSMTTLLRHEPGCSMDGLYDRFDDRQQVIDRVEGFCEVMMKTIAGGPLVPNMGMQ